MNQAPTAPALNLPSVDQGLGVPGLNVQKVPRIRYHVGLRPDAPVFSFHCEGITFARFSYTFGPADSAGNRDEYRRPGMYVKLTEEQVARCAKSIRNFCARFNRDENQAIVGGEVHYVNNPGFEYQVGDEPMSKFVYCRKAPEEPMTEVAGFDLPGAEGSQIKAAMDAQKAAEAEALANAEASEAARAEDPASQAAKAKHKIQKSARAQGAPDPFTGQ